MKTQQYQDTFSTSPADTQVFDRFQQIISELNRHANSSPSGLEARRCRYVAEQLQPVARFVAMLLSNSKQATR
jgi:hypothetical protein